MDQSQDILISIGVITYSSAATVVETLDSIAAQTYPRLELIISDDCSKDDTVAICRKWLVAHKDRFEHTELLTVEKNTGTSANCNRLTRQLCGDYYMLIAGDDKLLPNGVELAMQYINSHPDMTVLFTHHQCFGGSEADYRHIDQAFNYDFFSWSIDKQLHHLLFVQNCIPAVGVVFNRTKMQQLGIDYDERIPLMEDHPMWINLLRKGVHFDYLDQPITLYRVSGGVSTGMLSPRYYENCRRFVMLYQYPEWEKANPQDAIERVIKHEREVYDTLYRLDYDYTRTMNSLAHRIGKIVLKPFKWFRKS